MKLLKLEIKDIRNIRTGHLDGLMDANLIFGENGAGKTSILEAIFFLGMARSFRSSKIKPFINNSSSSCRVYAEFVDELGQPHRAGIERGLRGGFAIKVDGAQVSAASELARIFPVQLINVQSFALLEGSARERRKLLDWGVFHVEPGFLSAWRRVRRALTQRNGLLKEAKRRRLIAPGANYEALVEQIRPWDLEIAKSSVFIGRSRELYFERFARSFELRFAELSQGNCPDVKMALLSGWPDQAVNVSELAADVESGEQSAINAYLEALSGNLPIDIKRGTTSVGPHRADVSISVDGAKASDILSRGQQKLVVIALKLAQCSLFIEDTGRKPVLLADDLPAEVDRKHQKILLTSLSKFGMQCFFTALEGDLLGLSEWPRTDRRVFHVEQGSIQALSVP